MRITHSVHNHRTGPKEGHGPGRAMRKLGMCVEYGDRIALDVEARIIEATVYVTAEIQDGKRLDTVWDRECNGNSLEELD